MKKAAIFVRGNNIEGQFEICKKFAEKEGYYILGVTQDLAELTEDINVLIVSNATRLSRKAKEALEILGDLNEKGIKVVSVQKGLE